MKLHQVSHPRPTPPLMSAVSTPSGWFGFEHVAGIPHDPVAVVIGRHERRPRERWRGEVIQIDPPA